MRKRKTQRVIMSEDTKISKMTLGDMFKKYSEKIKIIAGVLTVLYPIINYVYELVFQAKCEEFYRIPGKYFSANINRRILYLGLIILLIALFLFPSLLRNYEKKHGKATTSSLVYSIVLSIILGLEMGIVNLYNLIEIMKATNTKNKFFAYFNNWLDSHAKIVLFVILIMGSISLLGIVLVNEIKILWLKKITTVIFAVSFTISGLLIVYGTFFKLGTSIEDKTKYEFITEQGKDYVVLAEYDDYVLAVEYILDKGKYTFDTHQYLFFEKFECVYSYIDTKSTPDIKTKSNP